MPNSKGFTLVELVLVIVIIGIAASIIGTMLLGVVKAWSFKFNRNDILWDGRLALDRMTREIRTIKDSTSVATATSAQFSFTDTGNKDITYNLSSANLNRTEDGTANLLAADVSALSFTYYNSSGTAIPSPSVSPSATDIRRVRINLTLTKNGQNVYLQSDASTKNF
ncbi:MAG: prepilin-type N-terminal cleavage/methylation domain-containing protein [Candidatus Omnitrophota bacterium]|nr:prepilin-type N-terminal cleavage/methylation domain-containing protein [Candidatus Omnitrophota bacterium]